MGYHILWIWESCMPIPFKHYQQGVLLGSNCRFGFMDRLSS
ncbi:hypothetical protein A2U01_0032072 [Trifolium medium]|uniref:Uncharacterized protein n=1 Tax=Trifolium medium TaxID=97028 RepID=A0A392PGQ3_9FABA|nr:hypothetical protein [Trifolium medium]